MGKINAIPSRVINCVYAALSSDTGGFKFSNVTASTHKLAAELIKLGAEHTEIDRMLYDSKSIIQIRVEGEAARRLKTCNNGKVAWISIPYSLREELSARDEHLDTVIDIARSLYGVEVSLSIRENADRESYRVSMRSVSDFDVSYVCARFGGGGHKSASGCTVKAASIEEAEQKLIAEIARLWDK
jgi:phosphoesterase RecJ-like protein